MNSRSEKNLLQSMEAYIESMPDKPNKPSTQNDGHHAQPAIVVRQNKEEELLKQIQASLEDEEKLDDCVKQMEQLTEETIRIAKQFERQNASTANQVSGFFYHSPENEEELAKRIYNFKQAACRLM